MFRENRRLANRVSRLPGPKLRLHSSLVVPVIKIALSGLTPWSFRLLGFTVGAATLLAVVKATGRSLAIGARMVLEIRLTPKLRPRFGGRPRYRVRAVVCRLENFADEHRFRVGVRFLGEA